MQNTITRLVDGFNMLKIGCDYDDWSIVEPKYKQWDIDQTRNDVFDWYVRFLMGQVKRVELPQGLSLQQKPIGMSPEALAKRRITEAKTRKKEVLLYRKLFGSIKGKTSYQIRMKLAEVKHDYHQQQLLIERRQQARRVKEMENEETNLNKIGMSKLYHQMFEAGRICKECHCRDCVC